METDQDQMEEDLVEAFALEQDRAGVSDTAEDRAWEEVPAEAWAEDLPEFSQ